MTDVESIFVYGSLRTGMPQHSLLAGARFLGETLTLAEFTLFDTGEWPAAITGGKTAITGEVYAVPKDRLVEIDRYERHPSFFRRTQVMLADRRSAWMWIYVAQIQPHWRSLDCGCWQMT
ncbi:MAG: gamma-glutamylcyclotransferase [Planctomycetaceae bacterium]|nr:gamma-glutamylcyclotransferase [Planctomycetaceae bacterium]|tara:strand:+ start:1388 stop:1747 length:360 start_codon:yes stop_codon:yes gene_type:complete